MSEAFLAASESYGIDGLTDIDIAKYLENLAQKKRVGFSCV